MSGKEGRTGETVADGGGKLKIGEEKEESSEKEEAAEAVEEGRKENISRIKRRTSSGTSDFPQL